MRYKKLVDVYEELLKHSSRLDKEAILSDFLVKLEKDPKSDNKWIYLFRGKVLPDYDPKELGISDKLVIKAIGRAYGIVEGEVVEGFRKMGGLVSFVRKKDLKRGGWYIYFWTLNVEKGLIKLRDKLEKDLGIFENNLESRKTKRFYYCENCDIEFNEESALLNDYACPECGELLGIKDNTGHVEHLGKSIEGVKETLDCVVNELGFLMEKDDKARERRFKAEDKKKLMERRERAAVRAALKKKELKKAERDAKKKGKKFGKKKVGKKKKVVKGKGKKFGKKAKKKAGKKGKGKGAKKVKKKVVKGKGKKAGKKKVVKGKGKKKVVKKKKK